MKFTFVKSKPTDLKFPVSTTEDPKVFEFGVCDLYGMREVAAFFQKNFVLNFPVKQEIRCPRNSACLGPHLADFAEFMIVDFNDVTDKKSRDEIIEKFKPFKHVAFKTKSTDDLFSFNFRLILATPPVTRSKLAKDLKTLSRKIHPSLGKVNLTTYRKSQITACGHNGIISVKEDGILFNLDEFGDELVFEFTKDIKTIVSHMFNELGFKEINDLGTSIIFENKESKTGNFVWFSSNPFELINEISGERVSILAEFKRRHRVEDFRKSTPIKKILRTPTVKRSIEFSSIHSPNVSGDLVTEKIKETLKDNKCLVIKSPMGSGKTQAIREMANKTQSCLIVTPRVSLADELYLRLKADGAKVYHLHRVDPKSPGIFICQFDSLFKIDVKETKFQTIIIDEFMTLCDHMNSSVAKNLEQNISKLNALMNSSDSMMVLDAFMEEISLDLIPKKFHEVEWVTNSFKDPRNLIIHKDLGSFLQSMISKRSGGLVVSCVSVTAGLAIKKFLESAGLSVGLINSGTPQEARELIIQDYNSRKHNAIVFTPSISVGVNILGVEGNQFHYDPGNVIPVIQSLQMTRRGRNSANVECFIKRTNKSFIPSIEEEKWNVLTDSTPGGVIFNEFGDRVLSNIGTFLATLRFHNKIWQVDTLKSFARLANQNFQMVTIVKSKPNRSGLSLSLRNPANIKELEEYQKLEIFGERAATLCAKLNPDEIDSFLLFEKFFRVSNRLEGWEICREDMVAESIFFVSEKLEIFKKCLDGWSLKEYNNGNVKLPTDWVEAGGMFWGRRISLNKKFEELCKFLHK